MSLHLEYLTDSKGKTKAVVIPDKEWRKFQAEYKRIKNKLNILLGLQESMKEVAEIRSGKRKARTLSDFLNEV